MKKIRRSGLTGMLMMLAVISYGQNERKVIRDGIRAYEEGNFEEAEVQFRKAESIKQDSYEAEFNTGAALYNQEKYEETAREYQSLLQHTGDANKNAQIWHNIGNSLLEAQQYGPSIEAYKNSLRKNPSDQDTKYNLAYAKQKLREQQEQQQQQDQQDQGNENKNKMNQDENTGQQGQNEAQPGQDENKNQADQDQEKEQQDQNQQPVPHKISKEDAERILNAIQQQEKDVKEKVDKKTAAAVKVKTEKEW